MSEENILKTSDGYIWDRSDQTLSDFVMHYDGKGEYVGQTQENMIDDQPPSFFFRPEIIDGKPCVNGKPVMPLTKEQMESAQ